METSDNRTIAAAALTVTLANPPKSPYQQRIDAGERPISGWVQSDLGDMLETLLKRDNLKIGDWLPWAIAVGINESGLKDANGDPLKYDLTKLQPLVRKPREKVSDLREQLRQTQLLMAQMMAQLNAERNPQLPPTPPTQRADTNGNIVPNA